MWLRRRWVKGFHTLLNLQGSSVVSWFSACHYFSVSIRGCQHLVWRHLCVWSWWSVGLPSMDASVAKSDGRLSLCIPCHGSKGTLWTLNLHVRSCLSFIDLAFSQGSTAVTPALQGYLNTTLAWKQKTPWFSSFLSASTYVSWRHLKICHGRFLSPFLSLD